jgi:anthranilate/para-aminobenzoate synthase component I
MIAPPELHFHSSRDDASARAWAATGGKACLLLRGGVRHTELLDLLTGKILRVWNDSLESLDWLTEHLTTAAGRWAGYLSYDLAYLFESIGSSARDDLDLPLFVFAFFSHGESVNLPDRFSDVHPEPGNTRTFTRDSYERAVMQAKAYIGAGDIFQLNLAQRFTFSTRFSAMEIHQRLLHDSPAVFGAMLDFGDFGLISNSPELFLKVEPLSDGCRRISTRPIKGTRAHLPGMEDQLRDSIKDQAELNMIIDLERNDLGRICQVGSVRVSEPRTIELHPTVYHGVATIEGTLHSQTNFLDLLRATFPGGSVTGAPKIRAMQLIDEIEPVRRGPYCGAIGYLDSDGSMQFNLAIRTIILKEGMAYISVGGGIVADSVPSDEYAETLVKAQAMFGAIGAIDAPKAHGLPPVGSHST